MARRKGSIRKRGDSWQVTLYDGADADGKRRYRYVTVKGTRRDAQRELTRLSHAQDSGTLPAASRETVDGFLDRWLESKRPAVQPRTHADYTYLLDRHVRPRIGAQRLDQLRNTHVQRVYNEMAAEGLSGRTVHVTHAVVRQAFAQAVRWRELAVNPADGTVLKRWEQSQKIALTRDQVRAFLKAAESDPLAVFFHVGFATGMRPGELLALRWEDVDLDAPAIAVTHSLERLGGRADWRLKETKAGRSRVVPIPREVARRLQAHRATQARRALRRKAEALYRDHGFVFAGRFGEPLETRNISRRHLKPILAAAKLPAEFRLYDMRHTCATLLAAARENPRVIADRLGHSGIEITLNTYTHPDQEMQDRATETLSTSIYG